MSNVTIHKAELAGYSSVVGQPIMLLNAQGAVIGQLSLIGAQGDYKAMVAEIADRLNAPNRHSYRVGVEVGRGSAAREIKEATDEAHACGAERAVWKERTEAAEATLKTAREALAHVEAESRRYAAMYDQGTDGRNTFIIFADMVSALIQETRT